MHPRPSVRKDLIYEGITTRAAFLALPCKGAVRKDLIYEGITTWQPTMSSIPSLVRKDLIYEGITTTEADGLNLPALGQKGPDLRRDYDLDCIT